MSTKDILIKARALIEKPENWTQRTNARSRNTHPVNPISDAAVCFCAEGALIRTDPANYDFALKELRKYTGQLVYSFNDNRSHLEVLNAFDKAIANCSQEAN